MTPGRGNLSLTVCKLNVVQVFVTLGKLYAPHSLIMVTYTLCRPISVVQAKVNIMEIVHAAWGTF